MSYFSPPICLSPTLYSLFLSVSIYKIFILSFTDQKRCDRLNVVRRC
nr:MAG TPA: hypothetical protein [Caudoviricetes sp.]